MCIPIKAWVRFSNIWFSAILRQLCREKEVAFRSGDRILQRDKVQDGEMGETAKTEYSYRLKDQIAVNDIAPAWERLEEIAKLL